MNFEKKEKNRRHRNLLKWMGKKVKEGKPPPPMRKKPPAVVGVQFPCMVDFASALDNLREKDSRDKFEIFLRKKGFHLFGSGYFSRVLGHPSSDKVVKILNKPNEDGWVDYIKWANEQGFGGSFAPKLYSYKFIKDGNYAVAVMEKLDKTFYAMVNHKKEEKSFIHKIEFLHSALEHGIYKHNETALSVAELLQPGYRKFAEAFVNKFARGSGYHYDMHQKNWMICKDRLVMSDPLSHCESASYQERFKAVKAQAPQPEFLDVKETPETYRYY